MSTCRFKPKSRDTDRCTRKKETEEFDRLNYSCKPHPWIFSDADCCETQSQTCFDHSFRLMLTPDFNSLFVILFQIVLLDCYELDTVSNYMYDFHRLLHQLSSIWTSIWSYSLIMLLKLLSLYASFLFFFLFIIICPIGRLH